MNEFTLGIEEEYMVVDPVTRELTSHDQKIVEAAQKIHKDQVKAEMHQAVVEVGTNICHNIQEAREEVTYLRKMILDLAEKQDLQVAAAGTHPFADWVEQLITPDPRYDEIIDEMRDVDHGQRIGAFQHQRAAERHVAQGFLRAQHRLRAAQAAQIEDAVIGWRRHGTGVARETRKAERCRYSGVCDPGT